MGLELPPRLLRPTHRKRHRAPHPPHLLRLPHLWLLLRLAFRTRSQGSLTRGSRRAIQGEYQTVEIGELEACVAHVAFAWDGEEEGRAWGDCG